MSLFVLAFLVSIGTIAGVIKLTTSAIAGEDDTGSSDSSLTVDVSSTEFTIELADEPVFAVLPVDITVEEVTDLGYTLTAYTDSTNLVSTTDSSKVIPMVTVDAEDVEDIDEEASEEAEPLDSSLVALSPNTYGLSFTDPESALDEVYTSLSTDSTTPTFITDKDYLATEANDTTTIYYGFYITPDTPYGTYTGSNITVDAIPNIATVTFDANGLYFNDSEEATINTVGYKPNVEQAPIEEVTGEYLTPAPLTTLPPTHYTFLGWSETQGATTPTYTSEEDILANLTLTKNESLTLYAVWHYDTVLSFNGTTSDGGEAIEQQTIAAGTTITLPHNTYTRTGSVFTGWNTVETPTPDNPGKSYADEASFTAPNESADITLYAQWAYTTTITFNGNGATSGTMNPQTIVAGTPETLTPNAFTRSNATFIGWNTQASGSGTSYSDEAEFIASTEQHQDITLYAQWAYTTVSFSGNTSDSGSMNSITIAGGTTSNLPAKAFTKNNCIFTGWNTEASGTGTSYGNSSPYTANATTIEAFTLYAQWQCISQVNYYGNGATSGEMASNIVLGGSTLTFPQNSYVRDGYIFNGWNTQPNGTGTSYPDQGTFTAPMTPATTLNLYAQWKQVFYMQDVATWGSTLSQGSTMEAVDKRDGKTYYVSRLADNKIWMTQNLDLDLKKDGSIVYDATTTNISSAWTPTRATTSFTGTSVSGWNTDYNTPYSADPGPLFIYSSGTTDDDDQYNSLEACQQAHSDCSMHNHAGNYYNWSAAVAMNDTSSLTTRYDNAPGSICPAGWRLPTGRDSSNTAASREWNALLYAEGVASNPTNNGFATDGFNKIRKSPLWLARFGYVGYSSLGSIGGSSGYWSSTVYGSGGAYGLYFGPSVVYTASNYVRYYGFSVRCIAQPETIITFDGNGADSGSMANQTIIAGTPQNLTPNAYTKDGHVFNGWNTVQTPTPDNPGTAYADKAQYTASTIAAENVTLYAQWKVPLYMQDVATWGSTLSQGDTIEAIDKRDGQEYTVARLADNKIWMTKNLNLAGGTEITSELSNVPVGYTLPTANGFQEGNKLPASSTSGFDDDTKAFVYNSTKTSGTDCTSPGCYSYYSWTAVTAGSGLSITADNTDAPYSICPKGWKLPSTRTASADDWKTESDFYKLAVAYGMDPGDTWQSTSNFFTQAGPGTTPNFLLAGYYSDGSLHDGGTYGYYWSSTSSTSAQTRYLRFNTSDVGSAYRNYRRCGVAARCIAE